MYVTTYMKTDNVTPGLTSQTERHPHIRGLGRTKVEMETCARGTGELKLYYIVDATKVFQDEEGPTGGGGDHSTLQMSLIPLNYTFHVFKMVNFASDIFCYSIKSWE